MDCRVTVCEKLRVEISEELLSLFNGTSEPNNAAQVQTVAGFLLSSPENTKIELF